MPTGLRGLVTLKKDETKKEQENDNNLEAIPIEDKTRAYQESGCGDSQNNSGDITALSIHLDSVYSRFQNEAKDNKQKQEKLNEPYRRQKSEEETIIKTTNVLVNNYIEKEESRKKI